MKLPVSITHLTIATISATISISTATPKKPNIVYIIADDLGYGDLSCYGQTHFKTPNIDSLAEQGIKFTSHYSGNTVCSPSRCSLMTGMDQGHASIRGNGVHQLTEEDYTVAHALKKAGYQTAMIGKSCVTGNTFDINAPKTAGFDFFYGTLSHMTAHHHYPVSVFNEHGEKETFPNNKLYSGDVYIQDKYTERALDYLETNSNKDEPFFLLLSFSSPHADITVPEDSVAPFRGKFANEQSVEQAHYAGCKELKATYAGMVTRLDRHVGSILAKLTELGITDNTIVSFTSDNGPHTAGGYDYKWFDGNGPLRGGKRDLYEGGIRIPFLARWPDVIKPGSISDHPSAFWDFLPTACDIAGAQTPTNIQGISFAPTLHAQPQPAHPYMYWEFMHKGMQIALRQGDWKAIQFIPKKASDVAARRSELYNLANDLGETNNLASKHPEKLKELLQLMEQARVPSSVEKWNF